MLINPVVETVLLFSESAALSGAVERLAVPGGCGRDCGIDEATQDARVACGCQPQEHPGSPTIFVQCGVL